MDRRDFLKSAGAMVLLGSTPALAEAAEVRARADSKDKSKTPEKYKMIYRRLGRVGIDVSAIALGVEGFQHQPQVKIKRMIDHAFSRGINFMDICVVDPAMLAGYKTALDGRRDKFVIQGHLCTEWRDGQYRRTRAIGAVRSAFEGFLSDLGTDYLDVGMIHYVDDRDDFRGIFNGPVIEYAKSLKKKGSIRCIGLSTHNPAIARMAVESKLIDVIMLSINLSYDVENSNKGKLAFNAARAALYELCEREGVALDVMKAYAGGNLLHGSQSPFGEAMTPVECLHYALTRPAVAAVMVGCQDVGEIDAAVRWCRASADERDYSRVLAKASANTNIGKCLYCGHCAPCPQNIDIASVNKYLNIAVAQKAVPETVRSHYDLLARHASDCIQCGACEARCPFGVQIREKMKQAANVFGK